MPWSQSFEAVRVGGHIALIGVLTGFEGHAPTHLLMSKQARLRRLVVGHRRQQQDYVNALNLQASRPVIDKVFDFAAFTRRLPLSAKRRPFRQNLRGSGGEEMR